ncbi:MAG: glycosyltransferase family 39 protein [Rickettsiales bacterium]|nr:glycosyltransferase family 39 protein [Rickettsiales bacterium]
MFPNIRNNNTQVLAIIFIVFLIKYLISLYLFSSKFSLSVDEAQYWFWSQNLEWGYYSKPPLIAFFIRIFTILFGNSEVALKIIPNLCVAVTSWFIFKLATVITNARIGTISIIIFSLMPIILFGSFCVTTDTLLVMFWSIALYTLYLSLKTNSLFYWFIFGLISALGLLSKYAFIFFYPCLFLYLFIFRRERLRLDRVLLSLLVTLIIIAPNIYWNMQHHFITFDHVARDNMSLFNKMYNPTGVVKFLIEQIGCLGLNVIILGFAFHKKVYKDKTQQFLLCFSLPIFVLIFIQALIKGADSNWTAPAFVSLSIYLAIVVDRLSIKKIYLCSLMITISIIVLIIGWLFLGLSSAMLPYKRIEGFRQLTNIIREDVCNDKSQVYLFNDRRTAAQISYYLRSCYNKIEYYGKNTDIRNYYQMKYPFSQRENYLFFLNSLSNKDGVVGYDETKNLSYSYKIHPKKNLEVKVLHLKKSKNK